MPLNTIVRACIRGRDVQDNLDKGQEHLQRARRREYRVVQKSDRVVAANLKLQAVAQKRPIAQAWNRFPKRNQIKIRPLLKLRFHYNFHKRQKHLRKPVKLNH